MRKHYTDSPCLGIRVCVCACAFETLTLHTCEYAHTHVSFMSYSGNQQCCVQQVYLKSWLLDAVMCTLAQTVMSCDTSDCANKALFECEHLEGCSILSVIDIYFMLLLTFVVLYLFLFLRKSCVCVPVLSFSNFISLSKLVPR